MSFQEKEMHTFLMPDYYTHFSCKMGGCRSACCVGWPISISMQNYFHLLGMDCPKALRNKLDCGLHIYDHPTQERYACFIPTYQGDCPLRLHDGRCSLHAEMGEEILPDICRLYPRGLRIDNGSNECSCTNSCEAVLEMLFTRTEPISFVRRSIAIQIPPAAERTVYFETLGLEQKIRMFLISILQIQGISLPQRIVSIGSALDQIARQIDNKDVHSLRILLDGPAMPQAVNPEVNANQLQFGLRIAEEMLELLDNRSQSIRIYGTAALNYFRSSPENIALVLYHTARDHFETLFPKWELFFENMLVNHMFFSQFPFQDRPESMHSEYTAICALYALLRFLALGWMAEKSSTYDFIDAMAAAFRLVDHTSFDRYAAHMLQRLGCNTPDQLYDLISL